MQDVSAATKWQDLVSQMPRPDPEDKILKNVEEGQVEKIAQELHAGGREAIAALVGMLVEPGSDKSDSQARHALHALVVHVGGLGEEQRRSLASMLAAELAKDRPAGVRSFLVHELRWCGGREATATLGKLLRSDELYQDAAMALLAIRDGAAEQFRAALADLTGPQRVAAIQALGTLKDAPSADSLRRTVSSDSDPVARLSAAWGLANIADAGAADLLLKLADEAQGFDRVRATDACVLLAENLSASGRREDAARVYRHLRDARPQEPYVRDVATKVLAP
jgi:HEAT repeats